MNYSELVQQAKDWLQTDETTFNANIPTFVKLAEEDIHRKAPRLPVLRKNQTSALTTSNPYLTLPADFLAPNEIAVISAAGSYSYLVKKDVSFIREAYPIQATTGTPKVYALFDGDTIIVGPTPSSALNVELHYYHKPTSIVTSTTSWFGDNASNALLWGTVLQGYAFLKGEPDLIKVATEAYMNAIDSLKKIEDLDSSDSYRGGE